MATRGNATASPVYSNAVVAVDVPFETWLGNPTRSCMTWVIAGRSCSGKSTLVENLLRLEHEGLSPSPEAQSIEVYHHNVGSPGVELTIVEIPGMDTDSTTDPSEGFGAINEELQNVTKGGADLLLYCVSIAPNARIAADIESKIIKLLTTALKPRIWERAIIIFTSADYVTDRHAKNPASVRNPTLESVMNEYAQRFEEILKAAINVGSFTVLPLYCVQDSERTRPLQEIPALPVGEMFSAKLLPSVKWEELLYSEMLIRCTLTAVPMLVSIGKNKLSKCNTWTKGRVLALWFGLNAAGFAYFIVTQSWGSTSMIGILVGIIIGSIIALFAGRLRSSASTWESLAHSIAQVRFQQDQVEKKRH